MLPPQDYIHEMVASLPWTLTRKYKFKQIAHVNLQETRALKADVKHMASTGYQNSRVMVLSDSRVCV